MTGQDLAQIPGGGLAAPEVPEAPSAATAPLAPPVATRTPAMPNSNPLKAFADVPFRLTIEIGRLRVSLKALAGLKLGKVFRIGKPAGEPFEICANGQPVARGEVVAVEDSAGVRITEITPL